jgi:hypothetical protein
MRHGHLYIKHYIINILKNGLPHASMASGDIANPHAANCRGGCEKSAYVRPAMQSGWKIKYLEKNFLLIYPPPAGLI